jgi:hypothetical protein
MGHRKAFCDVQRQGTLETKGRQVYRIGQLINLIIQIHNSINLYLKKCKLKDI